MGNVNVPREPDPFQELDKPKPGIGLAGIKAVPSGRRESVVIAMPALAHGRNGEPTDIVALNRRVLDEPVLVPAAMRYMRDIPVHGEADGDAHDHAPHDP